MRSCDYYIQSCYPTVPLCRDVCHTLPAQFWASLSFDVSECTSRFLTCESMDETSILFIMHLNVKPTCRGGKGKEADKDGIWTYLRIFSCSNAPPENVCGLPKEWLNVFENLLGQKTPLHAEHCCQNPAYTRPTSRPPPPLQRLIWITFTTNGKMTTWSRLPLCRSLFYVSEWNWAVSR